MKISLLIIICVYSIIIPFVIGCIKFKRMDMTYLPFILLIAFGFANEVLSLILLKLHYSNNTNNNIFIFLQAIFITWQFEKWRLFDRSKQAYWALLIFFTVFWLAENLYIRFGIAINSLFNITSSAAVAFMSIMMVNRLVIKEHGRLVKNPAFLICFSWLFYFSYNVLTESFMLYGISENLEFAIRMSTISLYINLITNLAYGFATLWIPTKPRFILPS
jgi:hypothetical protein